MTQSQTKPVRIVILSKAFGGQWEQQFFNDIQEAFDNGYRIAKTNLRDDASMRNFRGRIGKAVMYLEGKEPEAWKPAIVKTTTEDKEATKVEEKELSTGVVENTPLVDPEKEAKAKAEKEAEVEADKKAEKAKADKKAETAAKAKATKAANKAKKDAAKAK